MALSILCAVLLVPLLVVDVPPLMDYPNHLARVFVLASLPHDPFLSQFYAAHWTILPNLAVDLLAPPLLQVLPVHVVGRMLIGLAVLLPSLGAVAYNAAVAPSGGGRWWSLAVGLVAYNSCLLYGFLNFVIALGLALLLAAAWLRWREPYPRLSLALAMAGAPVLFLCHLMGLVFLAILIGSQQVSWLYRQARGRLGAALARSAAVMLMIFAAPAMLYALSALQQLGGDAVFAPPMLKLTQLVDGFANYDAGLDVAAGLLAVGVPLAGVLLRGGCIPPPAGIAMAVLLIVYLATPGNWKGTFGLDTRFTIMLLFMLFAGFVPHRWPVRLRTMTAIAVALLVLGRMAVLTTAWADHAGDLTDLRRVLQPVQPGQAVYVAVAGDDEAPAYWGANPHWRRLSNGVRMDEHDAALMVIEHRAYWPFEFDIPSQQPMQTRPRFRALADRIGGLPNRTKAAAADTCGFDYVLMLEADAVPALPAKRFRLLLQSGFAALYAITQCRTGA